MNHGDLMAVEIGNLAFNVVDLDTVVNTEDVDAAALAEEDFSFGWVCRVCLVVHCQACDFEVVLAGNDKERWRLVVFDGVWNGESQSHNWVLGSTRALGKQDLLTDFDSVWLHPVVFHWCTSEEHE